MQEKIYLALLHTIGITQKKFFTIFEKNKNYKEFYEKLDLKTLKIFDFNDKQIEVILDRKNKFSLDFIIKKLEEREVNIITIFDDNYPELLKQIPNSPYVMYVRGNLDNSPKIAVVGSRHITNYGEKVIEKIVPELSKYFIIVSGGAYGCDTSAHKETINIGNKTISVIGTGIDIDYPTGNKKLYDKIVELGGSVISIFPIGEVGNIYNFPIRNEIVAGLSVGTLVIEAKEKSGSLITANLALELGRDLFAIPGEIFKSNSDGCNNLIYSGNAKIVRKTSDILEEYNIKTGNQEAKTTKIIFADKIEEEIYKSLITQSLTMDELSKILSIDISTISFKVSMMEINGVVKKGLGGKYEVV